MALQQHSQSEAQNKSTLITETGRLVTELEILLASESRMMQSSTPEDLIALAQKKESILGGIAARETSLIKLFTGMSSDTHVNDLKNRLQACRTINEQNQQVALIELSHTRKSLEMLRSMLKMNDVPVYGSTGQVTVAREKRDFGSA